MAHLKKIVPCRIPALAIATPNDTKRLGGSPGLVVMRDDSCFIGHGFESQRHILDGHDFFHIDLL